MTPREPTHRYFDAAELDSVDNYKLLTGLVVPRPIGWIGSVSAEGHQNLAPYSFFNAVSAHPPTVLFSAGVHPRVKDTAANAVETGEFTVNIVTIETAEAMNLTAGDFGDVDEFEAAGLTALAATNVNAPRVAEATATLECRVTHTHDLGFAGHPPSNRVIFGEVVCYHVEDRVLDGTRIRADELGAIGRLAGSGYATTTDGYFELHRPPA